MTNVKGDSLEGQVELFGWWGNSFNGTVRGISTVTDAGSRYNTLEDIMNSAQAQITCGILAHKDYADKYSSWT
jgi:hypothetical protein